MEQAKVLIIEEDADIREGVRILLESEAYQVSEAVNGMEGLHLLSEDTDLVILDMMTPVLPGLKICEKIRENSFVPILFLTAKSEESDQLTGLMTGGDDYLGKPFSYSELLGRVRTLLRRHQVYQEKKTLKGQKEHWIDFGGIRICVNYNEVWVDGLKKELSDMEYQILLLMMSHQGKIFSAQNLYESIWDEPYFYSSNRTVMVHIRKLRAKIEKRPQEPKHIRTVWGKGYRFE